MLSQCVEQCRPRIEAKFVALAIDLKLYCHDGGLARRIGRGMRCSLQASH
jgi:hypothetical protein